MEIGRLAIQMDMLPVEGYQLTSTYGALNGNPQHRWKESGAGGSDDGIELFKANPTITFVGWGGLGDDLDGVGQAFHAPFLASSVEHVTQNLKPAKDRSWSKLL
jgi:hypothetical protein